MYQGNLLTIRLKVKKKTGFEKRFCWDRRGRCAYTEAQRRHSRGLELVILFDIDRIRKR